MRAWRVKRLKRWELEVQALKEEVRELRSRLAARGSAGRQPKARTPMNTLLFGRLAK
jgi:hypothetical protein